MSREALVLLVCCCDFRDGAERLISSKSLRNAVIRAFPGLFRILRMCAPRRAAAVVRPRGREKSADRRRRILISRLLIIRASVPRRKSPFPAYFKGFPAVSPLIPPYPAFLKYPVSPQDELLKKELAKGKLMIGESAGAIICAPSIQYIEQMDEKPEDYSQEDDAGLDLIDFYVLPHYLTAPFKKVTEKIMTEFSDLNLCPINNRQGIVIDGEGSKVICKD